MVAAEFGRPSENPTGMPDFYPLVLSEYPVRSPHVGHTIMPQSSNTPAQPPKLLDRLRTVIRRKCLAGLSGPVIRTFVSSPPEGVSQLAGPNSARL